MLKVVYGKKGQPVADHEVFDWVDYNIENYLNSPSYERVVNTSNELVLNTFAMHVLEGLIPLSDIEFYLEDEKLEFDPILGLQNPKGKTIGIYQEIMDKCLKYSYERMKKEKQKV